MRREKREKKLSDALLGCLIASGAIGGSLWSVFTGRPLVVLSVALGMLVVEGARAFWHYRKLP